MKLAIVYNPLDNKVREDTYSYVYRGMLDALVERFSPALITNDCSAEDIEADAILFWDVNSCHHITISGIKRHRAIKFEYMSDPFQKEVKGIYRRYNMPVHKLCAVQRLKRAEDRGVCKIICPVRDGFLDYYGDIIGWDSVEDMLLWFPPTPWFSPGESLLAERKQRVLANGATGPANDDAYGFRTWAYARPNVTLIPHWISNNNTPMGKDYGEFLKQWAGALALCDVYPVVKYMEMPLAGCVTFMRYFPELRTLGFSDMENCVFVNRSNFDRRINDFIVDIPSYQNVADAGRKLVAENYTARHFAAFVEDKIIEKMMEEA